MRPSSSLILDPGVRRRLTSRFGDGVESWFDELPLVLDALAERWQLEFGPSIPRGSVSVVVRCTVRAAGPVVLKVSPDRTRLVHEAAALENWHTPHTPSVLAVDESIGALLIEAIEPGTALVESPEYPSMERVTELLTSLHADGVPDPSYPRVAQRVTYLFDSGRKLYQRHPELAQLVPPEVYERGRRLATRLAEQGSQTVLLHGDLTPSNVLEGGDRRGLVAIDPTPCLGDPAFDTVDLLLWQADDAGTIAARADLLAPNLGVEAGRMLDWCKAFAGMAALEMPEVPGGSAARIRALAALAAEGE